jgi:hypothetical protein
VVSLAIALSGLIAALAAQHTAERRPAWHTWLDSLGLIVGFGVIIAAFVWVGRGLPA